MWTPPSRRQHNRAGLRYGSDLTDAERAILAPFLPAEAGCGRKRVWPMREIVNAICYVLRGGVAWRLLPVGFPPSRSDPAEGQAAKRPEGADGVSLVRPAARCCTWETNSHHLVMRDRERTGREASPTAAVVDSQSVKTTESGGVRGVACPRAGKAGPVGCGQEDKGAQAACDGEHGWPGAQAACPCCRHPGSRRRRSIAARLTPQLAVLQLVFADSGYQGPRVAAASTIRVEIVRKPEGQIGFTVHARRWVVERFFAWLGRNRRLAKDVEATIASAEAFLYAASAILLLRRLAR